jgi:integrase
MRVGEVCNLKISDIDSDRMHETCGLNHPSTKALAAKNKMPTQQLEKDKQHGNEEKYAPQRGY